MIDLAKCTLVFGYDKQPRNNHGGLKR